MMWLILCIIINHRTGGDLIRVLLVGGAILLFMAWINPSKAGEIVARDAMGRTLGRSVTDTRGNTVFYDAMGRTTGRAVTSGNTTTLSDPMGRQTGTVTTKRR